MIKGIKKQMRNKAPTTDEENMKWKKSIFVVIVEELTVLANELGKCIKK
ncbi:hypothetical protein PDK45_25125 [Bacillus cereus]|nr:hypothetical protein [Bacillus cereus]